MYIVVTHTEPELALAWQAALEKRLPQACVSLDTQLATAPRDSTDIANVSIGVGWQPPADFFVRHPALRGFFSAAAGVEHVLNNPHLPADLTIVRLEDAGMGLQMVEYCLHAVFRLRARTSDYEQQQRDRVWRELTPLAKTSLRIGVLGLGVLGRQVAQAFAGLGYSVSGFSRTPQSITGVDCFYGDAQLEQFLSRSNVLILLAPLTAHTRAMMNAARLNHLPRGAYLINVGRGGLLDDTAVLAALNSGQLSGASLDVFNGEPLAGTHRYWTHPNVRVTPHVSAITEVEPSADQLAVKIAAWVAGETISGIVDRTRGY